MAILTKRLVVAVALVLLLLGATGCRAAGTPQPSPNEASSAKLVEEPKKYDGDTIDFAGEVIGESMKRGDYAWLHMNDDAYYVKNVEEGAQLGGYNSGMAIWLPAKLAEEITYFGDYKHEGDIIEVTGTFNAACGEHGGDMDIHATSLKVLEVGHSVVDPVHPGKVAWAVGLSLLAALLFAVTRFQNHPARLHRR
jgi:hypothetical protein